MQETTRIGNLEPPTDKLLRKRILDLSYQHRLSHIGSCLTALPILTYIFEHKNAADDIVLSCGHAGLALYACLEKYQGHDAERLLHDYGVHPCRDVTRGISVSSGSLGSAILVACGMALGNREADVHCIVSDGEMAEGSVWEALRFAATHRLGNLHVHVNANAFSAYDAVDVPSLEGAIRGFSANVTIWSTKLEPGFEGLTGHYRVLTEETA